MSGNPASVQSTSQPFVLHSAYLTGAWRDGLNIKAEGYLNGILSFSKTVEVSAYEPTLVTYEFSSVDKVVWSSFGGTAFGADGDGMNFAMDNLSYDFVPEPSSILALLCGIGSLGGMIWRRKSA